MKENARFTNNFLKLWEKLSDSQDGNLTYRSFSELINQRIGKGTIDHSYISKMLNRAKDGVLVNPSIEKASAIAIGFSTTLNEMIGSSSLDNPEMRHFFNQKALISSFSFVDIYCEKLNITNPEFKAKLFEIQYSAILAGDSPEARAETNAAISLLCKEYEV